MKTLVNGFALLFAGVTASVAAGHLWPVPLGLLSVALNLAALYLFWRFLFGPDQPCMYKGD